MSNPQDSKTSKILRIFIADCIACCICAALVIVIFFFACWNFNQPPRAYHLADSLQEGMSKQEVLQILGTPNSDFGHQFAYSRFMAWGIFYVDFDKDGKLIDYRYDP